MSPKRVLFATLALLAVSIAAPTAAAKPDLPDPPVTWDCVQVYPWSQLCEGDVEGFLRAYCDGCIVVEPQGGTDCLQVYPWSMLCEGDVEGFIGAVLPVECVDCPSIPEPTTPSRPYECLQVYPWSRLCEGDVGGFLEAYCNGCVSVQGGPDCFQVYPWSKLCGGDVGGFVGAHLPGGLHVDCITMSPFWEICTANVGGLVRWATEQAEPLLP